MQHDFEVKICHSSLTVSVIKTKQQTTNMWHGFEVKFFPPQKAEISMTARIVKQDPNL